MVGLGRKGSDLHGLRGLGGPRGPAAQRQLLRPELLPPAPLARPVRLAPAQSQVSFVQGTPQNGGVPFWFSVKTRR